MKKSNETGTAPKDRINWKKEFQLNNKLNSELYAKLHELKDRSYELRKSLSQSEAVSVARAKRIEELEEDNHDLFVRSQELAYSRDSWANQVSYYRLRAESAESFWPYRAWQKLKGWFVL